MTSPRLRFVKGHGTENDFVLLPDRDDRLRLTPELARSLADRRTGIGGDGVMRVAPDRTAPPGVSRFFMDYRNADGTLAQMCGNGARLFARYLVDAGWQRPGRFEFLTRSGLRTAELGTDGDVSIGMGPVRIGGRSWARVDGRPFAGTVVDVGNPHLVCSVPADGAELDALELGVAPQVDAQTFPEGVNVEFAALLGDEVVRMRVHERGAGETRSCGTGCVAVAAVALGAAGGAGAQIRVRVPGGEVTVTLHGAVRSGEEGGAAGAAAPGAKVGQPDSDPPGLITGYDRAVLTGPAIVVADGEVDPDSLAP